jgi:hypothetical protein
MILTFSRVSSLGAVSVRAAFFRICADSTLRAPDSSVVATFSSRRWRLGKRGCDEFTCTGPVLLRIKRHDGVTERLGPYELVRAAEGALFTQGRCLGTHTVPGMDSTNDSWEEITLLPATEPVTWPLR